MSYIKVENSNNYFKENTTVFAHEAFDHGIDLKKSYIEIDTYDPHNYIPDIKRFELTINGTRLCGIRNFSFLPCHTIKSESNEETGKYKLYLSSLTPFIEQLGISIRGAIQFSITIGESDTNEDQYPIPCTCFFKECTIPYETTTVTHDDIQIYKFNTVIGEPDEYEYIITRKFKNTGCADILKIGLYSDKEYDVNHLKILVDGDPCETQEDRYSFVYSYMPKEFNKNIAHSIEISNFNELFPSELIVYIVYKKTVLITNNEESSSIVIQ